LFGRRGGYQSARSSIQRHARQTYLDGGKEKKCCVCGYSNHVDVAHIRSVSSFSTDTLIREINDIDNLLPLCPNHHWEYDAGIFKF
jgi:predicted restriction endonuclease